MLGASQFVNKMLFQFSGPDNFSSAQSLLRSFSRDLSAASFFSSRSCRTQIDFIGSHGRACASPRRNLFRSTNKHSWGKSGLMQGRRLAAG